MDSIYREDVRAYDILVMVHLSHCPLMKFVQITQVDTLYQGPVSWQRPVWGIHCLKFLPIDKIWDQSKLKALADSIFNLVQMMICVTDWIKNIVGKGENAGYQHFLLFPLCFQKPSVSGSLKVGLCGKELSDSFCSRCSILSSNWWEVGCWR